MTSIKGIARLAGNPVNVILPEEPVEIARTALYVRPLPS